MPTSRTLGTLSPEPFNVSQPSLMEDPTLLPGYREPKEDKASLSVVLDSYLSYI
jgi:hypothetical protein